VVQGIAEVIVFPLFLFICIEQV